MPAIWDFTQNLRRIADVLDALADHSLCAKVEGPIQALQDVLHKAGVEDIYDWKKYPPGADPQAEDLLRARGTCETCQAFVPQNTLSTGLGPR